MRRRCQPWLFRALFAVVVLLGASCGPWAGAAALAGEPPPAEAEAASPEEGGDVAELDIAEHLPQWAQGEFVGIAAWQYIACFLLILLGLVARKVSDHVVETRLVPLLRRTRYEALPLLAEAASRPAGYLLLLLGLFAALAVLGLPREPDVRGFAFGAIKILVAIDVIWFLFRAVNVGERYLEKLAGRSESKLDDQLVPVIRKALKATIAVIGFVWVVQLLGYRVSSLLAALGIGGLAVALALQDTLGNFFGSVFIFLDRPFAVGDWIKVEGVEGIVEDIGFRSTRIRTWPATLVSIPNKTVASSTVDNWSRMPKRRVMQTVGVTYETTADQMEAAVDGIRQVVEGDEGVDKEFIVVRFTDFGDSSLNILVYYFTTAIPFADHTATKQRINLAIMRFLRGMGLSIAFPTQTLYFEGPVAESVAEGIGQLGQQRPADREES
ncbi:MAG: mechanosensitive ion channel family protein [Candidatus Brocadiia bacterium]